MFDGIFDNLVYWHWWILAIVLIILEIFTPGAFFMWMGAAAGITGFTLLAVPDLSWASQFVFFSILSVVAITMGKFWFKRNPISSEKPSLNQREDELIGHVFKVEQAIVNGSGRVKVGESTWKANGPDCDVGSTVRVVNVDGAELFIELVN